MINPFFRTLRNEGQVALAAGLVGYGLTELLAPAGSHRVASAAFGLTAAIIAAGLDTYFFHLRFLLQGADVVAAEAHYRREMEDTHRRLQDGSLQLREALVRRFEQDCRRSVAAMMLAVAGESRRQRQEAKRRLRGRLWVLERVVPARELVAAAAEAKTDPTVLDYWTERVDGMVEVAMQLQRRQGLLGPLRPGDLARQTIQEWEKFRPAAVPKIAA